MVTCIPHIAGVIQICAGVIQIRSGCLHQLVHLWSKRLPCFQLQSEIAIWQEAYGHATTEIL